MNASTRDELAKLAQDMAPALYRVSKAVCESRVNESNRERMARHHALSTARGLTREVGIKECAEFLAAIQNIHASTKARPNSMLEEWSARLLELCTDFDAELFAEEPEVPVYGSERAELDAFAPRSNR